MYLLIAMLLMAVGIGVEMGARLERRRQVARHRMDWSVMDLASIRQSIGEAIREVNATYGVRHHSHPLTR